MPPRRLTARAVEAIGTAALTDDARERHDFALFHDDLRPPKIREPCRHRESTAHVVGGTVDVARPLGQFCFEAFIGPERAVQANRGDRRPVGRDGTDCAGGERGKHHAGAGHHIVGLSKVEFKRAFRPIAGLKGPSPLVLVSLMYWFIGAFWPSFRAPDNWPCRTGMTRVPGAVEPWTL